MSNYSDATNIQGQIKENVQHETSDINVPQHYANEPGGQRESEPSSPFFKELTAVEELNQRLQTNSAILNGKRRKKLQDMVQICQHFTSAITEIHNQIRGFLSQFQSYLSELNLQRQKAISHNLPQAKKRKRKTFEEASQAMKRSKFDHARDMMEPLLSEKQKEQRQADALFLFAQADYCISGYQDRIHTMVTEALKLYEAHLQHVGENYIHCLHLCAQMRQDSGILETALLDKALRFAEVHELSTKLCTRAVKCTLGREHFLRGDIPAAQHAYHTQLEELRDDHSDEGENMKMLILNNLSDCYRLLKRQEECNQTLIEAYTICKAMNPETISQINKAQLLFNIGVRKVDYSDYGEAIQYFQEALKIRREHLNQQHVLVACTTQALATMHINMGNLSLAQEQLQITEAICDKREDWAMRLQCHHHRCSILMKQEQYQRAATEYLKILPNCERLSDHELAASIYTNLGSCPSLLSALACRSAL